MRVESSAFLHNGMIPFQYTCKGEGKGIPLKIFGVPEETKSLVLIVHDPDAPDGDFTHWLVWNINPETRMIETGILPKGALEGRTSLGKTGWVPPCPPFGVHHYNFKVSALDALLEIPEKSNKKKVIEAMQDHIIENSTLVGLYGNE